MKISPIIFNNFNLYPKRVNTFRFNKNLDCDIVCFSGSKHATSLGKIKEMPEEAFPSKECKEYLVQELSNSDNKKDILDIHNEYYKDLLDCQTLDEAKERFPEFKDVINAKDLDASKFPKNSSLARFLKGTLKLKEAPDITPDNLSLELLKKYYGKALVIKKGENYWGFVPDTTHSFLDALNIKWKPEYFSLVTYARNARVMREYWKDDKFRGKILPYTFYSPEVVEKNRKLSSERLKESWKDDKFRKKVRAALEDPEIVEKNKQRLRAYDRYRWEHDEEFRRKTLERFESDEYKQAQKKAASRTMKKLWQDADYLLLKKITKFANDIAWDMHPECRQVYSEALKKHPGQVRMMNKKWGELTEDEKKFRGAYFKECNKTKFNVDGKLLTAQAVVLRERKKILKSWGFYEKDRDIHAIARKIGIETEETD